MIKVGTGTVDLVTPRFNEKVSTQATISNSLYPKPHFNKAFFTEGQEKASLWITGGWLMWLGTISSYTANNLSGITTIASLEGYFYLLYYDPYYHTLPFILRLNYLKKY